jgi:hypothetical protein
VGTSNWWLNTELQALVRRKNVFKACQLPCLSIIGEARISLIRHLLIGEFCIIFTASGVRVGQGQAVFLCSGLRTADREHSNRSIFERRRKKWQARSGLGSLKYCQYLICWCSSFPAHAPSAFSTNYICHNRIFHQPISTITFNFSPLPALCHTTS